MEEQTPLELVMTEVVANLIALSEYTMENVAQPPRGSMKETGHYRTLNQALKRKDIDALQQLVDELTYNVAATIFATLDGSVESEMPDFPDLILVERGSSEPLAQSLHKAFAEMWSDTEDDAHSQVPHPD